MNIQERKSNLKTGSHQIHLTSVPLPAKKGRRRVLAKAGGIVPLPNRTGEATDGQAAPGSGVLVFHSPCDAPASTTTSNGGGTVISNVSLQLLFWGSAWNSGPTPSIGQVINSVNSILQGPYMSGLAQYGVGGGNLSGAWIVTGREPNNPFSNDDVHGIISDLIDQGSFPEPDDPGGRNLYMFVLPANVHSNEPHTGFHTYDWDYDFPFDIDKAWFGWVTHNGALDSLTPIFSHELVEACTDPEGDGIQVNPRSDSDWNEIGDVCCSNARVNGVLVQSYWSDQDLACIVPIALPGLSVTSVLEFGRFHLHEPSDPKPVTITNVGASLVSVSIPPSPKPGLHTNFFWDESGSHQLNPGDSLEVNVTFAPTVIGPNGGELKFSANAVGSPFTVHLRGQGIKGSSV
jgi:hypothetical protein